ncbi:hypothetical protein DRQ50_05915 [bacterium]|nr:MAG: hypothetical protein DRQ50_05915 [bacterium]
MHHEPQRPAGVCCTGRVTANAAVSTGLIRLDLELEMPAEFLPGQFAMLNPQPGSAAFVFNRPFSIYGIDGQAVSFLYRIVGRGTAAMGELVGEDRVGFMGPLGRPFPVREDDRPALLLGGGVGLPPVAAWLERWGRDGDLACFGARDGGDAPWQLLDARWGVSVDEVAGVPENRTAFHGRVTALGADRVAGVKGPGLVLACGPVPLLKAARDLARDIAWECWLSLEEHMGCGYGVCKGCVVPVRVDGPDDRTWRNATCCDEGPVFAAADIAWERYALPSVPEPGPGTMEAKP